MEVSTIAEFFEKQCSIFVEHPVLNVRSGDRWHSISYRQLARMSQAVAAGLLRLKFSPGQRACILGNSSPEWLTAFFAVQLCGGVDVCLDPERETQTLVQMIQAADCRLCFITDSDLYRTIRNALPKTLFILLAFEENADCPTLRTVTDPRHNFAEPSVFPKYYGERLHDDPASILYRHDDTTRAVVLTHRNVLSNMIAITTAIPATEHDSMISSLPFWQSPGRMALFFTVRFGGVLYVSSPSNFLDDLKTARPSIALSRPDVFHRLYQEFIRTLTGRFRPNALMRRLYATLSGGVHQLRCFLTGGLAVFRKKSIRLILRILTLPALLLLWPVKWIWDIFARQGFRRLLGGNLRAILIGGDYFSRKVDHLFQSMGVDVLEGYWMTEGAFMLACRVLAFTGQRNRLIPGTVGPMLPGTALKLVRNGDEDVTHLPGEQGEIYVRGDQIMQGYFRDPVTTSQVLDENGWLKTGDQGRLTLSGELQLLKKRS